ncbi:MAG: dhaL [Firmicutes bacterium]|nr:dhaL [Bacillota bacterium]
MLDSQSLATLLGDIAAAVRSQRDYLSELDNAIGDGDHGHNLAKGFDAVAEKVLVNPDPDLGKLLQQVGMTLISTVGGAAGPLYGTAFLRMATQLAGKQEMALADLPQLLDAAIGGIKQRGKAERGEKTMLDSLIPAQEALAQAVADGKEPDAALELAAQAAEAGVAYTRSIRATKGRASYLGERSVGHQDPGATSTALILRTIQRHIAGSIAGR